MPRAMAMATMKSLFKSPGESSANSRMSLRCSLMSPSMVSASAITWA